MATLDEDALSYFSHNAVVTTLRDTYIKFSERRAALGLSNPGTVDNIAKEVQKDVFLNNLTFSGLRADLTRAISVNPLFQFSHAFSQGSQGLPPYTFAALYGTPSVSNVASKQKPVANLKHVLRMTRSFYKQTLRMMVHCRRVPTIDGHRSSSPRRRRRYSLGGPARRWCPLKMTTLVMIFRPL